MELVLSLCAQHVDHLLRCTSDQEKRVIKGSLQTLIRKWCDEKEIVFVSKEAFRESQKFGVDLFKMQWKDQPKFDKGRVVFHLEHKYTVGDMIRDMLSDPSSIYSILSQYQIGWILKSEDKVIQKTNRKDHDKVYEEAGIDLIYKV